VPARTPAGSAAIDRLDRLILHALTLVPRVPFARVAAVLGVSEQTVARRYQRMRSHGIARVIGVADYTRVPGATSWMLRLSCRPGTATATADALARRTDTSWVAIGAGGAELTCSVTVADARPGLLDHLPRAANVLSLSAHQVLHRFVGRGESDWILAGDRLAEDQRQDLLAGTPPPEPDDQARLTDDDRPLLTALGQDGRASFAHLAAATGWTQRRVALRLAALAAAGLLRFDVDIAVTALGFRSVTTLWFTVAPADLAAVGARLADHQQLAWAAAVTGSANVVASALFADAGALYRYLTTEVAAIAEVQNCEAVPLLTRVKQAVSLVDGGMLRSPVV
jgi:DNA-binding Lrp family transcriptional regulator